MKLFLAFTFSVIVAFIVATAAIIMTGSDLAGVVAAAIVGLTSGIAVGKDGLI